MLYLTEADKPVDMVVKVSGAQWYWNYEYPDQDISFDSYIIAEADLKGDQKRMLDVDNPPLAGPCNPDRPVQTTCALAPTKAIWG